MNYLAVRNTLDGHATFLKGVKWYYPVATNLSRAQSVTQFFGDSLRESRLLPSLPPNNVNKVWRVLATGSFVTSTWWVGRNPATGGQAGQISTYLDFPTPGLTNIQSILTAANGTVNRSIYLYDALGYARTGTIDPNRDGGLPKYAALHTNVADGSYTLEVKDGTGKVLRREAILVTGTQPNNALTSPVPGGDTPDTPDTPDVPDLPDFNYTGIMPLMTRVRVKYSYSEHLATLEVTGSGEWHYKVGRTQINYAFIQRVPDWGNIAWQDVPGGAGARTFTVVDHPNMILQVLIESKSRPDEKYEISVTCSPGDSNGFDWVTYIEPQSGFIDRSQPYILPNRTWTEDLTVTFEAGPTDDTITLRMVSGFARDPNTRWFWNVSGIDLVDKADQDNITYVVSKGIFAEVFRYITPITFQNYGDTVIVQQWRGTYYLEGSLHTIDKVDVWTGL